MSDQDRDLEQLFQLDDAPGPASPIDDKRAAAIVAAAIGGAGFGPGGGGTGGGPAGGGGAKLLLLGGAGAIVIAAVVWIARPGSSPSPPTTAPAVSVAVRAAGPPVEQPPPAEQAPRVEPPPAVVDVPTAPPPRKPPPAKPVASKAVEPAVEDLLADANRERVAHHWDNADKLYARVVALPHAPPLKVEIALVASASLHLEHFGDPRGATRRFQDALAIKGSLAEDARWGLVEAARANGDTAGERAALEDFLNHHPQSPLAERARIRSKEL